MSPGRYFEQRLREKAAARQSASAAGQQPRRGGVAGIFEQRLRDKAARAASQQPSDVGVAMPSGGPAMTDTNAMKRGGAVKAKKMAKGGTASKRADGCATKGKTKGRFV